MTTKYVTDITISKVKYLGLFKGIPHKYLKNIYDDDDDEFMEVEIEDFEAEKQREWECSTRFKFELPYGDGKWATITSEITYNTSSPIALTMCELINEDEDDSQ